jgi:hypothetical protein
LSLVALVTFGLANAQIKEKGTIEITPKIGSSSFFENNEGKSTDSNAGIQIGVSGDYYFNNRWSLRSGFVVDKMGGKYYSGFNKFEDKLNYLSIPINANWHFGSTRKWNLNFGLSPSFLTNATTEYNGMSQKITSTDMESFQLGFTYGIGYKIEITKKFGLLIDGQFFDGLTNINKTSDARITNSGYSFNLGGVIQL